MDRKPIKDPGKLGHHIRTILDDLRQGGATDIEVYKNKHLTICFNLGEERFKVFTLCTPNDLDRSIMIERGKLKRIFEARLAERGQ